MNRMRLLYTIAVLLFAPAWTQGAERYDTERQGHMEPLSPDIADDAGGVFLDGRQRADHEPMFLTRAQSTAFGDIAFRFGWWGVDKSGNPIGVGEYDGLDSSAFYDIDGIHTDGQRTADFHITGAESESTQVGLHLFGPLVTTDFEYERFLHRLDRKPLGAFLDTPDTPELAGEDFDARQDYAIRVQKLDTSFHGRITDGLRWRLNVWGMRKHGRRQATALSHNCGTGRECHMVSQSQNIDWLTMEIEPVIEANCGPVTAEYSRTMRSFVQNDDVVSRSYGGFPVEFIDPTAQHVYAVVPENFTQIDRLKLRADLTYDTQLYTALFLGDTKNRNRDTHRHFGGVDLRVTNTSVDGLTLTGYGKWYEERNQLPTTFPEDPDFPEGAKPSEDVRHPVDRARTKAGLKGRWQPFRCDSSWRSGLAVIGGYEYESIERSFVTYDIIGAPDAVNTTFTQPDTTYNTMHVGTQMRWSSRCDTFIRYRMAAIDDPLFGVTPGDEGTVDVDLNQSGDITALNTNQPRHEDIIQFGGTWTPTDNFLMSAWVGIELARHRSAAAQFDEEDYPVVLTAWYAPTCRWSVSGGLAFYSNWIDQDITIGNKHRSFRGDEPQDTELANYTGRAFVVNLGTAYACTDRLNLNGGFEFVRAENSFVIPSPEGADWSTLGTFSDVLTETTRFWFGADYLLRDGISCYFYYNYYNWDDDAGNQQSGNANMFLGGLTAVY